MARCFGFQYAVIFLAFLGTRVEGAGVDSKDLWDSLAKVKKDITLTGWVIPNEFEGGELVEFLLARYPSGCIHVPLPPPSSIVHVRVKAGARTLKDVRTTKKIVVHGVLSHGERVDSSFELLADSVQEAPLK